MTEGLQLLVQLMTAAMTTEPWASWYSWPQCRKGTRVSCFSLEMWKPLKPTCKETNICFYRSQLWEDQRCIILTHWQSKAVDIRLPSLEDNSESLLSCCWLPLGPVVFWVRSPRAPWSSGWFQTPAQWTTLFIWLNCMNLSIYCCKQGHDETMISTFLGLTMLRNYFLYKLLYILKLLEHQLKMSH